MGWSSKLMVDDDSMGPSLQWSPIFHKVSQEFKLHEISILHEFQIAIFPYCWMIESHGWAVLVVLHVLCMLT